MMLKKSRYFGGVGVGEEVVIAGEQQQQDRERDPVPTRWHKSDGSNIDENHKEQNPDNDINKISAAESVNPVPFFIMDWLERINPAALHVAQQMLQSPTKDVGRNAKDIVKPKTGLKEAPLPGTTGHTCIETQRVGIDDLDEKTGAVVESQAICMSQREPPSPSFSDARTDPLRPASIRFRSLSPTSTFRQRSLALGNGWNAKGLEEAKRGAWSSALACWENALAIRTQVLGESHADVANTCNNMGIACGRLDRCDVALQLLHRALRIRTALSPEHVEVAATLHNMGNVLHQCGDYEAAIGCFSESRRLQSKLLGHDHVQVARTCVAMGHTYLYNKNGAGDGREEEARRAFEDALETFRRAGYDDRHPEVKTTVVELDDLNRRRRIRRHQQSRRNQ